MRGRLFLMIVSAGALLASGCASKAQLGAILAADAAQTAKGTSRVAVTFAVHSTGMSLTITQTGAFDYAHSRGYLRGGGVAGPSQVLFLPPHVYVEQSDGGSGGPPLPNGKTWLDLAGMDTPGGPDGSGLPFGPFPGEPGGDPAGMLSALAGVSDNVTQAGSATIRGAETVHYRVTIDLVKAQAKAAPSARAGIRAFATAYGKGVLPAQVWVDGQGKVRRIEITITPPTLAGAPAGTRIEQTIDFYDFGVPVRVTAPPASAVTSLSQFAGGDSGAPFPPPGASVQDGGDSPPRASGTMAPGEASAAESAVRAFWASLASGGPKAAAQAVLPTQRSCLLSAMAGTFKFKVGALTILSARPHGTGHAVVSFKVRMSIQIGTTTSPASPDITDWLAVARSGGRWYVDLLHSGPGAVPCTGQ